MAQLIIMLAKIFAFGLGYFLIIGILTVILTNIGKLLPFQKYIALAYSVLISLIYIFLYSFWGAYLKSITDVYSEIYHRKWVLVILCLFSIFPWIKYISNQVKEERAKMNSEIGYLSNTAKDDTYTQSITVIALNMNYFILISYLVFLFTSNLHNAIYFNLPDIMSRFFIK